MSGRSPHYGWSTFSPAKYSFLPSQLEAEQRLTSRAAVIPPAVRTRTRTAPTSNSVMYNSIFLSGCEVTGGLWVLGWSTASVNIGDQ